MSYQEQDTEPFINLKDKSRQGRKRYYQIQNGFNQVREPNLSRNQAVRFFNELLIVFMLLPIDIDDNDDDGCIQIQYCLKSK